MRLHPLPWPTDVLSESTKHACHDAGNAVLFCRTKPGCARLPRYGYQSHGLQFAVKTPLEGRRAFEDRINKHNRDDDYEAPG